MKKSFHVFFLFVLFAFFAVNAAWAEKTLFTDPQTGERYVYMPDKDEDYLNISAEDAESIAYGVKTFTVNAGSSFESRSRTLVITVPEGYRMEMSYRNGVELDDCSFHFDKWRTLSPLSRPGIWPAR